MLFIPNCFLLITWYQPITFVNLGEILRIQNFDHAKKSEHSKVVIKMLNKIEIWSRIVSLRLSREDWIRYCTKIALESWIYIKG